MSRLRLYRTAADLAGTTSRVRRAIAIGAFDGIHLGHQAILKRTGDAAVAQGLSAMVFSFEPLPVEFMRPDAPPARLTRFAERFRLFAKLGLDEFYCPSFRSLHRLSAQDFIHEILLRRLSARHLVVGQDFRFGAGRGGSLEDLQTAGRRHGFTLDVIPPVEWHAQRVSSTAIRQALATGDLVTARAMLGRDYSMSGRVIRGLGLGRKLGFPTANVSLKRRKSAVDGIFAVRVGGLGRELLDGVASVGTRPTIGGGEALLEVLIFDFDHDIYDQHIDVHFLQRLRGEVRFPTLDAMKVQIQNDIELARAALRH